MVKPVFVDNPNIEVVDIFTFKCKHCDTIFNPEDVSGKCKNCDTLLFEPMRVKEFTFLFIDCLSAIGVQNAEKIKFINNKDVPVCDLAICTEMSIAIDLNFQLKFGGQYGSFLIKDNFSQIKANNFGNGKKHNY